MKRTIVLVLLFVAACGDGSSKKGAPFDGSTAGMPPSTALACSRAASAACGGDIVGTWKLAGVCSHSMTEQQIIDKYSDRFGESVGPCGISSDILDTGYAKFRPDGTWQIDEMMGIAIGFSESCLSGIGQSCDSVRTYTNADASFALPKTCQSSNGVCLCSFVQSSHPNNGSYITDGTSYHLYDPDGSDNALRGYCIQGDVISVLIPGKSIGGEGVAIAVRTTETVVDMDASITLPRLDAAPDLFRNDVAAADALADKPKADSAPDLPRADVLIDGGACTVGNTCTTNSGCSNGLTCQKFKTMNGQTVNTMLCMPAQCTTCTGRTCIYDDDPKVCGFVECQSDDAGAADAPADKPKTDAAPVDAPLVPSSAMVPSMAAVCPAAAAAPCGGDLTGSWSVIGICDRWLSESEFLAQMAMACSTRVDYSDVGTVSFNSDGTCIVDEKATYTTDYATSCLAAAGDTCADKDARVKKEIGKDYVSEASCAAASADVCMCSNTFDPPPAADACTYSLKGNALTFVSPPSTFSAKAYDYCVKGNSMTIFFTSWSEAGAAAGNKATMVLSRLPAVDAGLDAF